MSWFSKAFSPQVSEVIRNITQWFNLALRGSVDSYAMHQDLDRIMPSVDDPEALETAISGLQGQVQIPAQQNVLDEVRARMTNNIFGPTETMENTGGQEMGAMGENGTEIM